MKKNQGILVALLIALAIMLGSSYALYASVVRQVKEVPASVTVKVESCTLDLALGYDDGTLTMDFELGTREPTMWGTWTLIPGFGVFPMWSTPLPFSVDPAESFPISIPGIPPLGTIGILTALITSEGIICSDWETVNTGSTSSSEIPSIEKLRELFPRARGVLPNN